MAQNTPVHATDVGQPNDASLGVKDGEATERCLSKKRH
jgi:hypothetical protein